MARWLSFFAEYNFRVEYKPGRLNVVADALSRRPDFEPPSIESINSMRVVSPTSTLANEISDAYASDVALSALITHLSVPTDASLDALTPRLRAALSRYEYRDGILYYRAVPDDDPRVVIPDDPDLKLQILSEYHDAPKQ